MTRLCTVEQQVNPVLRRPLIHIRMPGSSPDYSKLLDPPGVGDDGLSSRDFITHLEIRAKFLTPDLDLAYLWRSKSE